MTGLVEFEALLRVISLTCYTNVSHIHSHLTFILAIFFKENNIKNPDLKFIQTIIFLFCWTCPETTSVMNRRYINKWNLIQLNWKNQSGVTQFTGSKKYLPLNYLQLSKHFDKSTNQ